MSRPSPDRSEVTRLLWAWQEGDPDAFEALFPLVYEELRRLARGQMARERRAGGSRTLQPTALVHESYLRLVGARVDWEGRQHFLAIAARVMRQVLVDAARERGAAKRGSGVAPETLDELQVGHLPARPVEILALDQALERLAAFDERRARTVELRLFAGLTIAETARVLEVSPATVERDARVALAWLRRELEAGDPGDLEPDGGPP